MLLMSQNQWKKVKNNFHKIQSTRNEDYDVDEAKINFSKPRMKKIKKKMN